MKFCDDGKYAKACLQTDSEHRMHKKEQTMLKSPGGTKAMGQDLALAHKVFRNLEKEPGVAMGILLVRILCRCSINRSCSRQSP